MSTETVGDDVETHDEEHHEHPSDWKYIQVGIVLAVLTAIEVALFYFPPGGLEVPALLFLMVVKFVIVAAVFMHLQYDSRVLAYIFVFGMILAAAVYLVLFAVFEFEI